MSGNIDTDALFKILKDPKNPIVIGCQTTIQIGGVGEQDRKECITQASHYNASTNTTNVYSLTPEIQQKLESSTEKSNKVLGLFIASLKPQPQLELSVELTSNVFDELPPEIIHLIGQKLESKPEDAYRFALATKHVSTCMAGIIKTIQPEFFKNLLTDFFQSVENENNSNKIELPMFFLDKTGQNTIAHIYIFFYSQSYSGGVERLYRVKFRSMTKDLTKNETFTSIEKMVNYIITDCLNNITTRKISIGTDNNTSVNYNFDIIDKLSISLTELEKCNHELIFEYKVSRENYNDFFKKINRFETLFTMYNTHLNIQGSIIQPETYKNLKHLYTGKTDDVDTTYDKEVKFINSELLLKTTEYPSLNKTIYQSLNISEKFKTISQIFRNELKKIDDSYQSYFDKVQALRESIILHGYYPCKDRKVQNAEKVTNTAKVTKVVKTIPGLRR